VRLIAHPDRFFDAFSELAQQVTGCARHLHAILSEPARTPELMREMASIGEAAELGRREVIDSIAEVVVTPIDREQVHQLASRLGELVNLLGDAGQRVSDLRLEGSVEPARDLSEVLVRVAGHVELSVSHASQPRLIAARRTELELLVDEGNAIYDRAVSSLFADSVDPVEVLRWKEVYDVLQDAIGQCKEVETIVSSIALENQG
jgi:uncharacterized protein